MRRILLLSSVAILFLLSPSAGRAGGENPPPAAAPGATSPQTQTAPATDRPAEVQARPLAIVQPATLATPPAPRTDTPVPGDEEIAAAVEQALAADPEADPGASFRVRCEVGTLTLSGKSPTLERINQARRLAGSVRGVLDVVVTASVSGAGTPDTILLLQVQKALGGPAFSGDDIAAAVGVRAVRLSGTVSSYTRKLLAEKAVSEVPGVAGILNNLRVTTLPEGSNEDQARRAILLLTSGLTPVPGEFEITVDGSLAVLRGRVPLFYHRILAQRVVLSVGGLREVDNRLIVDPTIALPAPPSPAPAAAH